ncbi:MAG: hypothetical protein KAS30_03420, partial [Candidatus Diapherotrites archaeon]|nr:hypothetical protein [Candidatus Diapherotrites archaeon]
MKKNHLRNKVRLPHMSKMRVMKKGFTLFTPLVGMVILVISLVIIVNIINTEKTRVSVIVDYQSSLKESATIDFAKIDAIHTIMFEYKNQLHNMFLKKYFENDFAGAIDLSNDRRNLCDQLKLFIESGVKTDVLTNLSTNVFKSAGTLKNVDSDQLENIGEYSLGLFGTFTNYDVTFLPSDCFSSKDGSFAVEVKPNSNLSSNEVAKIIILN